jgi:hypothetical protein
MLSQGPAANSARASSAAGCSALDESVHMRQAPTYCLPAKTSPSLIRAARKFTVDRFTCYVSHVMVKKTNNNLSTSPLVGNFSAERVPLPSAFTHTPSCPGRGLGGKCSGRGHWRPLTIVVYFTAPVLSWWSRHWQHMLAETLLLELGRAKEEGVIVAFMLGLGRGAR